MDTEREYIGTFAASDALITDGLGFFSDYMLAFWGPAYVLFVSVVFGLQLFFSYLWLSRFRYGPMEWVWRAITYWQLPAMRRQGAAIDEPLVARQGSV